MPITNIIVVQIETQETAVIGIDHQKTENHGKITVGVVIRSKTGVEVESD